MLTEIRNELSTALKTINKEFGRNLPDFGETLISIQPMRRWGYSNTFKDYAVVSVNEFLKNPNSLGELYKEALDDLSSEASKYCNQLFEDALEEIARENDMEVEEVSDDEELTQEADERAERRVSEDQDLNTEVFVTWRFDKMIHTDWFILPEEIILGKDVLMTDYYEQRVDSADDLGWSSDFVEVTDAKDIVKDLVKNKNLSRKESYIRKFKRSRSSVSESSK